uniref:Uncharacterized protein n=1 Tax=Mucochytrium quahogii TaxID=96639 RepID=A0A7S2WNG8_9STRA|mmetsp:Transcript_16779/g.27195  ORF Transcript_16779/g.27195 Transcript_16779/m.27195 type:complete len:152 (+) Transcript_16779:3693-4148(+)
MPVRRYHRFVSYSCGQEEGVGGELRVLPICVHIRQVDLAALESNTALVDEKETGMFMEQTGCLLGFDEIVQHAIHACEDLYKFQVKADRDGSLLENRSVYFAGIDEKKPRELSFKLGGCSLVLKLKDSKSCYVVDGLGPVPYCVHVFIHVS